MDSQNNRSNRRNVLRMGGTGLAGFAGLTGVVSGSPGQSQGAGESPSDHNIETESLDQAEVRSIVGKLNSSRQFKGVKKALKDYGVNVHPNNGKSGKKMKNRTVGETSRYVDIDAEIRGNVDADVRCTAIDLSNEDDIKVTASLETSERVVQVYSDGEIVNTSEDDARVIDVEKGNPVEKGGTGSTPQGNNDASKRGRDQ